MTARKMDPPLEVMPCRHGLGWRVEAAKAAVRAKREGARVKELK